MNRRGLLGGLLLAVCLATLCAVWSQRSQLAELRAEQQQLVAQVSAKAGSSASALADETESAGSGIPSPALVATPELLRLRGEVTQLTERRRELASARAENERLRAQLAGRSTNGPAAFRFPPGFVRKSEAKMVGYTTPDDTLQSFLWAVRNHDLTNVLQAFAPEKAKELRGEFGRSGQSIEGLMYNATGYFGMQIVKWEQQPKYGSIIAQVEVVPGVPGPTVGFRKINGQWKIDWGL